MKGDARNGIGDEQHHLLPFKDKHISWLRPLASGAIGGTCSTVLLQPLDLLKTRLQAPQPMEKYLKIHDVLFKVVKKEGVARLWRGLTPTLLRVVPGIGFYFCTLEGLQKVTGVSKPTPMQNLLFGFASRSFVASILIPVTVLKTRFESNFYSYGTISLGFRQILSTNGISGLYSGIVPTLLRDAPFSALYLMFYRYQRSLIGDELLNGQWSTPLFLMCGVNAGVMACFLTHPFDMIKTQMQLFPEKYPKTLPTAVALYQSQGFQSFFRGIVPRACRRTLMSALSWTVYEKLSQGRRTFN